MGGGGFLVVPLFCGVFLDVLSCLAISLLLKRDLVALLCVVDAVADPEGVLRGVA